MAKKPLGKDKFGVQKVMRVKDYFGDCTGQFALNCISGLVGQMTYFYTDKVYMAAGAIATVLFIVKVIDAFTDLIMGNIIDHTKPGKERYRPWLIKAGVPAGILVILMFCVPNTTSTVQIIYALVTNVLLSAVLYTAMAVPYTSLMTVRTNSQEERGTMGIYRSGAGYAAGFILACCIIPITNALGGTQSAWIKFGFILGLVVILCAVICYLTSHETATETGAEVKEEDIEQEDPVPFKEAIVNLFHNKYWVIVLVVNLMANILYSLTSAAGTYYCKWIFGNDNLVSVVSAVGLIPTFLGFALAGPMIKKLGVVNTLKVSFSIGIIGEVLFLFTRNNFICYAVFGCATTFATIPMMCLTGTMTAMSIDYNEYKYGKKMIGTSNSASSFGGKIGSGVGSSVIGWILALVGYDATLEVATAATKNAIYGFSIIMPLVMFAVMLILVSQFDLEKTLPAMKEEIAARDAQKAAE